MITMWVNIMNLSYYLRVFTFIEKIMFIAKKKILPHLLSCLKPLRTNVLKFNGLPVQF